MLRSQRLVPRTVPENIFPPSLRCGAVSRSSRRSRGLRSPLEREPERQQENVDLPVLTTPSRLSLWVRSFGRSERGTRGVACVVSD